MKNGRMTDCSMYVSYYRERDGIPLMESRLAMSSSWCVSGPGIPRSTSTVGSSSKSLKDRTPLATASFGGPTTSIIRQKLSRTGRMRSMTITSENELIVANSLKLAKWYCLHDAIGGNPILSHPVGLGDVMSPIEVFGPRIYDAVSISHGCRPFELNAGGK